MTIEELVQRQNWSLNQKIDHAVGAIEAFIAQSQKKPYLAYSGGSSSTVLLDITRRFVDKSIKAVYCNTGNEWLEIVKFIRKTENVTIIYPEMTVKQVIEKYGFPLISKEQSQYIREARHTKSKTLLDKRLNGKLFGKYNRGKVSNCWKFLINTPFEVSEKCCYYLKKKPFYKYEKETGEVPILGIMAEESGLRMSHYIQRGGCNSFTGRIASYPMSIFTKKDIWEYKNKFKIPFSPIYDNPQITQTGCMICGFGAHFSNDKRFNILFDLYPKAYKQFMEFKNNGVSYREALRKCGICLPDEHRQLSLNFSDLIL